MGSDGSAGGSSLLQKLASEPAAMPLVTARLIGSDPFGKSLGWIKGRKSLSSWWELNSEAEETPLKRG